MVVLGVTGRRCRAAAAVAVDGRIVSAVSEGAVTRVLNAGYRGQGLPGGAVSTCLGIAGVPADAVDIVVIAEGAGRQMGRSSSGAASSKRQVSRAGVHRIGLLEARSRLGSSALGSPLVVSTDIALARASVAEVAGEYLQSTSLEGVSRLLGLARRLAAELGVAGDDPTDLLSRLESIARAEPDSNRASMAFWTAHGTEGDVIVDERGIESQIAQARVEFGDGLRDGSNPLVKVQRARSGLAEGFLTSLASAIAHLVETGATARGCGAATLAGSAFIDPDFNGRIQTHTSIALTIGPAPAPEGAALGAALHPFALHETPPWPDHLSFGPSFTEPEAKAALENCRLDYVYEPSWPRLMERISRTLSRGKLVAWFQDAAEFCTSVGGSRSILCDPSNRYARDNINRFLRQQADDTPIGLSVAADAPDCLTRDVESPWMVTRATIASDYRERLRAAVDAAGHAHVHVVHAGQHHLLHDLVATHWRRTGVPGLLNTALQGVAEPVACSPRDAIRTAFSSAVDAMVIHRFLVMKDYWQLRTEDA